MGRMDKDSQLLNSQLFEQSTLFKRLRQVEFCSTLLVPPQKLVPPEASGDILQTNTFGTQRFSLTMYKPHESTKAIWIIMFKSGILLIFARRNTNIEKINKTNLKEALKIAKLHLAVGLCLRLAKNCHFI